MIRNYFKIAIRSLLKNKAYAAINIAGLAVGMACCLVILLYVEGEVSYDNFHPGGDRLYRMAVERTYPEHTTSFANIPSGFAEAVKNEIPGVEQAARAAGFPNFMRVVSYKDKVFEENYVFYTDSSFIPVLGLKLLQGSPATVLKNPGTAVLPVATARKYFGDENPLGKILKVDRREFEVVGVIQDIPERSHLKIDFLLYGAFLEKPDYVDFSTYTYLKLSAGADPEQVQARLPGVVEKYASGQIERQLGRSYKEYVAAGNGYRYFLQPIRDIHLHSNLENEIRPAGSILYVYLFVAISGFILVIACINFVNLATARSVERAKEVGLRKVAGSSRFRLILQFLTESLVISFLSLVIAFVLVQLALPLFNNLTQKQLLFNLLDMTQVGFFIGFAVLVGLLAGLYPAFYISSLNPVEVLKGNFKSTGKGLLLRNGLVAFQFAVSIILITGIIVMYGQMNFIQNTRLGFDKENVIVLGRTNVLRQPSEFKKELLRLSDVRSTGGASSMPGGGHFPVQFQIPGQSDILATRGFVADDHFLETLGMNIVEGRDFSEQFNDSLSIILNQKAAAALGLKDPVGVKLVRTAEVNGEQVSVTHTVIGVVKDYHFESLYVPITPLAILCSQGIPFAGLPYEQNVAVRFQSDNIQTTLSQIEVIWKRFAPDQPFVFSFLDGNLDALYKAEAVSGNILGMFTFLAIIIACIGLFGLASYTVFQRTREIGIRKILGANISGIVALLSKDFLKLVLGGFVIAVPISSYAMSRWLENFAYRIDIEWWMFALAGLAAIIVAIFTVATQAIRAAVANPVKSLRVE